MPVFNEEKVIKEVVEEYLNSYQNLKIVLVDDCSTDETSEILSDLVSIFPGKLFTSRNELNLGHGPSFTRALKQSLLYESDLIISCDGDGPLPGKVIRDLIMLHDSNDMTEVVRVSRREPGYRKFVSLLTRWLVFFKSFKFPKDANTPIRLYQPSVLREILKDTEGKLVPNLIASIVIRRHKFKILQVPVEIVERKPDQVGTMWKTTNNSRVLPNKRFLRFCWRAFMEVLTF